MPPGTHAVLGASGASRWMNCPGSVRLSRDLVDAGSEYAREGTAAHDLGERALRKQLDPEVWLDTEIDGVTVDEEMVEAVRVYVDFVRESTWRRIEEPGAPAVARAGQLWIERQFDLAPLNPPGPMFGTSDAVIWHAAEGLLHVIDYKHGAGVAVDATENKQLRYYALGAVLALGQRPERVRMTIVQPRASHPGGIIRSDEITWGELVAFKRVLFAAAEATLAPDAPLVPGDHCRFCRAAPVCPAIRDHAVAVAQSEFSSFAPPAPETLTPDELAVVLGAANQISDWLKAVESYALGMLDRGETLPGWKLVPKRATRKWAREDALQELEEKYEITLHVEKPMSPAQAEKALKAIGVKLPDELVEKVSSGPKLAPDHDPRPALVPSAQEDFAGV